MLISLAIIVLVSALPVIGQTAILFARDKWPGLQSPAWLEIAAAWGVFVFLVAALALATRVLFVMLG